MSAPTHFVKLSPVEARLVAVSAAECKRASDAAKAAHAANLEVVIQAHGIVNSEIRLKEEADGLYLTWTEAPNSQEAQ